MSKQEEKPKLITDQLLDIAEAICNNYCKYPEQWDEEKMGVELSESKFCQECPLSRL
jgi:hypothetical protein